MKNATYAEKAQRPGLTAQRQVDEPDRKAGRTEGGSGSDPRIALSNLPAEPGARALRRASVLQMQRERGNAYVTHVVQALPNEDSVQRAVNIDEMESTVDAGSPVPDTWAEGSMPSEMAAVVRNALRRLLYGSQEAQ